MDFGGSWESHLPLIKFAYNNSYQASIQIAPFKDYMGGDINHQSVGSRQENPNSPIQSNRARFGTGRFKKSQGH